MKLDKALYKKIKNMNRNEMKAMLDMQFSLGFNAGVEAGSKVDLQIELFQFLEDTEIRGVGPITKDRILKALKEEE